MQSQSLKSILFLVTAFTWLPGTAWAQNASDTEAPTRTEGTSLVESVRNRLDARGLSDQDISLTLEQIEKELEGRTRSSRSSGLSIDPALAERLEPDQIERLLKIREDGLTARRRADQEPPIVATVVPIGAFLFILGLVAVPMWFKNRSQMERQLTLRMMVDKGVEIPSEMIAVEEPPRSDLRRGIILVFAGAGIGLFLRIVDPTEMAWSLSLVPFMIGLGYLVTHRLESRSVHPV